MLEDRPDMEFVSQTIHKCSKPGIKSVLIFHSLESVSLLKKEFLTQSTWKQVMDHYNRMRQNFSDVYIIEAQDPEFGRQFKKITIFIERKLNIFPYSFPIQESASVTVVNRGIDGNPTVTQTNVPSTFRKRYNSIISGKVRDHTYRNRSTYSNVYGPSIIIGSQH